MNWNTSVRQAHRWVAVAFTVGVVVNVVALGGGEPPFWVYLLALLPLGLLEITGLYLLVQPLAARRRSARGAD